MSRKTLIQRIRDSKSPSNIDRMVNAAKKRRGKVNRGVQRVAADRKRELQVA